MPDHFDMLLAEWVVHADEVDRPVGLQRRSYPGRWNVVLKKLRATLHTGRAVRFNRGGMTPHSVRTTLGKSLRKHGLSMRTQVDGEYLIAWVEDMPDAFLQRGMKEDV